MLKNPYVMTAHRSPIANMSAIRLDGWQQTTEGLQVHTCTCRYMVTGICIFKGASEPPKRWKTTRRLIGQGQRRHYKDLQVHLVYSTVMRFRTAL